MQITMEAISKILSKRSRFVLIVFTVLFAFIWLFPPNYLYFLKGLSGYLPLHMLMETFSIIVAAMIFSVGWEAYGKEKSGNIVIIATAFLAVVFIDFAHMLSFAGMPVFVTPSDPEKAIFFWLCGRFFVAVAMLYIVINTWKPLRSYISRYLILAVSLMATALIYWVGLWHQDALPHTFIPGHGLTPLKIYMEWSVVAILAVAAIFLIKKMLEKKQSYDAQNILMAIYLMILSEIFFMLYADVADLYNFMGHVYKVAAYYYLYRAIFVENIQKPYKELEEVNTAVSDLYNNAPCGYHSLDREGMIVMINDTELSWLGYTREEIIGKMKFTDILTPKSVEIFKENFPQFKERGWVKDLEFELIRKDGTTFPILISATTINDSAGNYLMSRSTVYDITELKHVEQELQEKEQHSQSLLRISKDLELAQTYGEVIDTAREEVKTIMGYQNIWVYLFSENKKYAYFLAGSDSISEIVMSEESTARLTITGDPMLEEIASAKDIVVVEDARIDPRTDKEIVARTGNRTIVNVPIIFFDKHLGSVGMGTFGDEGIRVPTKTEEGYLRALANHMAVTFDRLHLLDERKKAEEALTLASLYNRSLIEASLDPLVTINSDGKITDVNAATEAVTGLSRRELVGTDFSGYFSEPEKASAGYHQVFETGFVKDYPLEIKHKNGNLTPVVYNASVYKDKKGKITGVFAAARDVTEQKHAEQEILKLNRIYRMLSDCNQSLIRADDENNLIANICRIITEEGGYRMAWVGYPQNDEGKTIKPIAYAGHEEGYLSQRRFSWGDNEYGRGPTGTAIRTGQYFTTLNYDTDPNFAPWKEEAKRRGYASSVAFPLTTNGKPFGALSIYGGTSDVFNKEELMLLQELASDLAFGIMVIRTKIGREHAQVMLNEAQRIAHLGSWYMDLATNEVVWSEELYKLYGFDPALPPPLYTESMKLFTPQSWEKLSTSIAKAVETGTPYELELETAVKRDGNSVWMLARGELVRDARGAAVEVRGVVMDITERKLAEQEIRHANAYNRSLIEASLDPLVTISPDGKITDVNLATEAVTGRNRDELIGTDFSDYFSEPEKAKAGYHQVFEVGFVNNYPLEIKHKEGHLTPVIYNASIYRDEEGSITGVFAAARDVSEQKKAEQEILKLNRVYQTLSACNEALVHAQNENKLLSDICHIIVERGGYMLAWVGYRQDDEQKTVRPIAQAGYEEGFLESIRITWADEELGRGPTGMAIRTGKISVNQNMLTNPAMLPWRDEAIKRGYASSIGLPLSSNGDAFASLTIYAAESDAFSEEEIKLLQELAHDLAFGITTIRTRIEREHVRTMLSEAQRLTHIGSWELDLGSNLLSWSDEIYRIFEIDPAKFGASYEAFLGAIHPDDRDAVNAAYTNSLKTKLPYTIDHRLLFPDGRIKYVHEQCETYYDKDDKPLRSVGTVQDVTELKLTEEALRENEHFLDNIIENIPNMLFVKEAKTLKFIRFNKAGQKLLGYSQDELIGKNDYDFFPKEQADFFTSKDQEIISGGKLMDIPEEPINTKYLGQRYLHTKKIPVFADDGTPLYLIGISEDITELREAREALKRLNEVLEAKVKERTAQLEVMNKELEAFTYSVSHDLRAPLRSIDGFSAAVMEDYGDKVGEGGKEYLQRVRGAAQKMGTLIDDLLSLSRLTRGELNRTSVNLSTIASDVVRTLREADPDRVVDVIIADNMTDEADPHFMEIVFTNLLNNAWKFTSKKDKAKIEFNFTQKGGKKVYYIKDNGAGFDMNYAGKMFQPFQRLHTAEEFPGTGIGLTTVHRIIKKHGGDIWAEGEVDKGATFYFTLGGG